MILSVLECMGTFGITGAIAWIVLVAVLLICHHRAKKEERRLEEQLAQLWAEESAPGKAYEK